MTKKLILVGVIILCLVALGLVIRTPKKLPASYTPHASYVALGDSVAAGVGLENYSDASACDRTQQAYPNQVASTLNLKLTSFACSGATVPAGLLGKQEVNQLMVSPQLDQLFSQPKPQLITLTVGANDAQWTTFISKCYTGQCGSSDDSSAVNTLLATLSVNLQTVLSQIQSHYNTATPHVIVTGYYQVVPTSAATCSDLTGLDPSELLWLRQQQANLNTIISSVASSFSFAKFVPINFSGHELCTPSSWIQGLNDNQPYHPTDAGQAAYAKQVIDTYKSWK